MSSKIKAGDAYVAVHSDLTPMAKGLKTIGARFTNLGSSVQTVGRNITAVGAGIGALGASILAPMAAGVKSFISAGDALQKMSDRTGVAASALSELNYAAEQSGTDLAAVEGALKRAQLAITQANDGSQSMADAFGRVGLNARQLASLSPDQQFQKIAAAIAAVPDPTIRAARAMEIFGRSGTQLLPLITSNLAELRQEARDLGVTLTNDDAKAAAELGDAFGRVGKTGKAAFMQIGASMAPVLTPALNTISKITANIANWTRENRGVAASVGAIGAGFVGVGSVVGTLGLGVMALGSAIRGVGIISGAVATVLSAVGGAPMLAAIAGAVAGYALIGGAIAYVLDQGGLLKPLWNYLSESFNRVFGIAKETFAGVTSALSSGEWGTAAKIAWAGIKLAVLSGGQQVLKGIDALWNNAGKITANFLTGIGKAIYSVFSSIPKIISAALKGGTAIQSALSGAIASAFSGDGLNLAGQLDEAIVRSQKQLTDLNKSVALKQRSAPGMQQGQGPGFPAATPGGQFQQMQRQFEQLRQLPQSAPAFGNSRLGQFEQLRNMQPHSQAGGYPHGGYPQRPIPQVPSLGGVVAASTRAASPSTAGGGGGDNSDRLVSLNEAQVVLLRRILATGALN